MDVDAQARLEHARKELLDLGLRNSLLNYRAKEWGAQLRRREDDVDDGWWIF